MQHVFRSRWAKDLKMQSVAILQLSMSQPKREELGASLRVLHACGGACNCMPSIPKLSSSRGRSFRERERDCFYYIIEQTYDVGLHSRRHPMEFDAGTRPFASVDAPSSLSRRRRERRVCVCVCVFTCVMFNIEYIVYICI